MLFARVFQAMSKTSNMVAHLVMEPAERADASERPSLVASYGCLAKIESVRTMHHALATPFQLHPPNPVCVQWANLTGGLFGVQVRRLEIGALVVVRGLSRLRLVGVAQVGYSVHTWDTKDGTYGHKMAYACM